MKLLDNVFNLRELILIFKLSYYHLKPFFPKRSIKHLNGKHLFVQFTKFVVYNILKYIKLCHGLQPNSKDVKVDLVWQLFVDLEHEQSKRKLFDSCVPGTNGAETKSTGES